MTYNFLKEEGINKSGTIFTLAGKIWGYDISLFNYYNEKEILIEPERKFKIDEVMPPINDIIHIRDFNLIVNKVVYWYGGYGLTIILSTKEIGPDACKIEHGNII